MTHAELQFTLKIPPADDKARRAARERQQRLTKPRGALGRLELLSERLAAMRGTLLWYPSHPVVIICAADHGIAARGVSAYPQAVTAQMVRNFLQGGAAVNVLARQMNASVHIVDAGIIGELPTHHHLTRGKIAPGTADFSRGRAMTDQQANAALALGMAVASAQIASGADILCVGEMGIGNTTSASAIIAAMTGSAPARVTGRGTGLDDDALAHKVRLIETALSLHEPAHEDTLSKIGGFEIGVMAGVMLGAAAQRVPVVIDGLISTAGALIAAQIAPQVTDYLIASHRGSEPGHIVALEHLGLQPLLDLEMRLGEGTGALLALPLIEAAMRTLNEMATFDEAGVSDREADDAG